MQFITLIEGVLIKNGKTTLGGLALAVLLLAGWLWIADGRVSKLHKIVCNGVLADVKAISADLLILQLTDDIEKRKALKVQTGNEKLNLLNSSMEQCKNSSYFF